MSVELRIQLTTRVVSVGTHDPVSGGSIFVQGGETNPGGRVFLCFFQCLAHGGSVRGDQSLITANNGHHRDGLRCRKCHVIKRTGLTLLLTIAGNAICPVTLPEEFSCLWVETLTHCLEILGGNLSFETKQFSAASAPSAFDSPILVVVIALPKVTLSVALTAGHGTNRQHSPTLALFEIRDQPVVGHTAGTQMNFKSWRNQLL